jgi:putative N6-adenine-specific DNA methylase
VTRPTHRRPAARGAAPPASQAPSRPTQLACFAAVAPGLEALALAEARALGLPAVEEEGGFGWTGDLRSVIAANVGLRIASRVLVRLDSFEAVSFADLERRARRVAWGTVVRAGDAARFRVTCKKSRLYHSDAVAQRLADALVRTVPGARVVEHAGDEETGGDEATLFVVRFFRDRCTISVDTSGALLHRRGYRMATAKAPLRETLAAALLAASGWDGLAPLVDPLCGSGTIAIEGAWMARGIVPGANRSFAVERWPEVREELVREVRAALAANARAASQGAFEKNGRAAGAILGSDRDAGAIEAARGNAARAGVADDISFAVHALSAAPIPADERGWIVTNPPYGVRVGESGRVRDLWAQLGKVLRARAPGWQVALLSPDQALERALGFPLRTAARTTNGGIPVRIMVARVPF